MNSLHQELLRQAVEAARAGERDNALSFVKEVLEEDEENVRAWLLLARLTDNDDERRIALKTVLALEPDNQKARELLDKLEGAFKKSRDEEEVIPGVTRRQIRLAAIAASGVVVLIVVIVVGIVVANNREESRREQERRDAAATAQQIIAVQTQTVLDVTETAFLATQTQVAIASPTVTPLPDRGLATLPPTFTPVPTVAMVGPTSLPAPEGISGRLFGWSGRDLENLTYLPIVEFPLDGGQVRRIGSEVGRHTMVSADGQRIAFTRLLRLTGLLEIGLMDAGGEILFSNLDNASSLALFNDSYMPSLSADGMQIVFIGQSTETRTDEVYLVDLREDAEQPAVRITSDTANYSYPSLSPDGRRIVAVRDDLTSDNPGPDLVIIDIASRTLTPLTTDRRAVGEAMPRWNPTGTLIVYAGSEDGQTHDIYITASDGRDAGFKIIESAADDIYPVFSPAGEFLAFASNRTGSYDIFVYDLNSQRLSQLTQSIEINYPGSWID